MAAPAWSPAAARSPSVRVITQQYPNKNPEAGSSFRMGIDYITVSAEHSPLGAPADMWNLSTSTLSDSLLSLDIVCNILSCPSHHFTVGANFSHTLLEKGENQRCYTCWLIIRMSEKEIIMASFKVLAWIIRNASIYWWCECLPLLTRIDFPSYRNPPLCLGGPSRSGHQLMLWEWPVSAWSRWAARENF